MKVTMADYALWSAKQSPRWAAAILEKQQNQGSLVGIHACINARVGSLSRSHLDAGNLVSLLKSARRRGANVREYLRQLASSPGTLIRPERRGAYAKKWLRRLPAQNSPCGPDSLDRFLGAF